MTHIETGFVPLVRATPVSGLTVITAIGLCWLFVLFGAGMGMDVFSMSVFGLPGFASNMSATPNGMTNPNTMSEPSPLDMAMMWWGMMMAMMLPGTLRHLPLFDGKRKSAGISLGYFLFGYALVWLGFSLAATALQYGLVKAAFLHPMKMWSTNALFSATMLTLAGFYQFTRTKEKSLSACQVLPKQQWPLRTGIRYGVHCMLASVALMCLLFVGGVMNIYWIIGLTIIVVIEKHLPAPRAFSVIIGLTCFLSAAVIAISIT